MKHYRPQEMVDFVRNEMPEAGAHKLAVHLERCKSCTEKWLECEQPPYWTFGHFVPLVSPVSFSQVRSQADKLLEKIPDMLQEGGTITIAGQLGHEISVLQFMSRLIGQLVLNGKTWESTVFSFLPKAVQFSLANRHAKKQENIFVPFFAHQEVECPAPKGVVWLCHDAPNFSNSTTPGLFAPKSGRVIIRTGLQEDWQRLGVTPDIQIFGQSITGSVEEAEAEMTKQYETATLQDKLGWMLAALSCDIPAELLPESTYAFIRHLRDREWKGCRFGFWLTRKFAATRADFWDDYPRLLESLEAMPQHSRLFERVKFMKGN